MGYGDNCFDEEDATENALHAERNAAELREVATLAYRSLEDAHRVISTIDGDDTHEQWELDLLSKRVKDAASSLFVVLRHPQKVGAGDTAGKRTYMPGSAICEHGYEDGKDCDVCYARWQAERPND